MRTCLRDCPLHLEKPLKQGDWISAVGVSYKIAPNRVKNAILDVLSSVSGAAGSPQPMVRVSACGDFAVHYEVRYPLIDFARSIETEAEIMNLLWYASSGPASKYRCLSATFPYLK